MVKIWLDDERTAPKGYIHFHSVNETIDFIENSGYTNILLDLDHDLGEYSYDGGDAIKLILWLLENDYQNNNLYKFHFQIHTMNPVGRQNMQALIERYFN